ncbi:hypothetical protein EG329_004111 [Mollisiaceae sp. DMI_Dod_QoI]|nr:hypothetical protein EG329_004111 [Helotiales sp. DMI_Dod_QoI]
MREFDENYEFDDFNDFRDTNQTPDSYLQAQARREQRFEDAFMDDTPETPAPQYPRLIRSIEQPDTEMSRRSYAAQYHDGDVSASTSFEVKPPSVKSESEDVDLYAAELMITGGRHGSVQPIDMAQTSMVQDSQEPSDEVETRKNSPSSPFGLPYPSISRPNQDMSVQPPDGPTPPVEELVQRRGASEIAGSDEEDDIMVIEPDHASPTAQRKWQQYRSAVPYYDVPFIKEEPKDVTAPVTPPSNKQKNIQSVLAHQRAMLARTQVENGLPKNGGGNSSSWRDASPQAEASTATRKGKQKEVVFRYETPNLPDIYREGREDPMQLDAAMRIVDEDNSWMDHHDEADEEYDYMKAEIATLKKKLSDGVLSSSEKMQLFKLEKQLLTKERLRNAANQSHQDEEDDSLFIPDSRRSGLEHLATGISDRRRKRPESPVSVADDDIVDGDEVFGNDQSAFARMLEEDVMGGGIQGPDSSANKDLGFTKAGKPRKRRAKNAKEFYAQEEDQRREKERNKAMKKACFHFSFCSGFKCRPAVTPPKPPKGKAGKTRAKAKENKKGTKGKGKKGEVKNGESLLRANGFASFRGGNDVVGQMILEDLMANDPIQDRLMDPVFDRPEEPAISGRLNKETQFQQLFANIPETDGASNRVAKDDKKKLRDASRSFGYAQCKAQDGKWLIKGMESPLYHHQLLGAQWMVQRELSSQQPNGGLLADSMGLGKTVQMLACMVGNPPGAKDLARGTKATLIVVPAGVIDQWLDEIRHHTAPKAFQKILHYKTSAKVPRNILEDLDIVVTSYNEVMKQFPYPDAKNREKIQAMGYHAWWKVAIKEMGDLHHINWYRVVLDEAQAIKNNSARTSLACQNLKSVYRWCLTGTPLLNRLEELFPYLRFLKANFTMDWGTFQKFFCDVNAEDSYSRISTLLSYTMMRRTMKTTILNRPIITLPKPHPEVVHVQFSPEEQIIYRITENRFRSNLNTFFAKGSARRNYGVFMVQLLRLRQCTGHPFMLERTIKESWTLEDVTELQIKLDKLGKLNGHKKPFYEQCKLWVEESEKRREEVLASDEDAEVVQPFGKGDYGHSFNFGQALSNLSEEQLFRRVVCNICADIPMAAMKTDCGHIFCEECLSGFMQSRINTGDDYMTCPACDRVFTNTERVQRTQPIAEEDDYAENPKSSSRKKQIQGPAGLSKGRDALGFEPSTSDSTWVAKSDYDPNFPLTPSSKTTALKSILLKGFADAPMDKVVVYVQFRTLARIIGRICESEGWGFLYLTGDSSLEHRTKVIRKFRDDSNIKILVAGLKCGGLGLNFPWANRCISLDLWWNHAVEQQAFGRIFRIGQEKETYMTRLVVKNSVDMRMMTMQLHKLKNLEKAMRDGEYHNREQPNLSLKQLANLFGFLKTDADDNIISVEADYDDEPATQEGEGSGKQGEYGDVMDEEL